MNDINLQFVWGMRIIGKGHSSSKKLCASLNIPSVSKAAYRSCEKKLLNVASVVSKNAMIEAADEVRKLKNTSDVAECGVSVDGTWQRRGHSSLNGCVAVLSIDTGKVVDLEVMSKWCRNCNTSESSEKSKHVKNTNARAIIRDQLEAWNLSEHIDYLSVPEKPGNLNT
ncbi:uncharacterized protein TNCV_2414251 [Trichonephila clavipes]|nr:uncharacterized protein TNCV_2414251 [Trichonephila clavipes]